MHVQEVPTDRHHGTPSLPSKSVRKADLSEQNLLPSGANENKLAAIFPAPYKFPYLFLYGELNGFQDLPLLRQSFSAPPASSKPNLLLSTGLPTRTSPSLATPEAPKRPVLSGKPTGRPTSLAGAKSRLFTKLQSHQPGVHRSQPGPTALRVNSQAGI